MTLRDHNLHVFNTLGRQRQPFEPADPPHVGMYVCGPTVYGDAHIGHAKSYVAFDVIHRYLEYLGYEVTYVQNITDVGHLTDDADEGEDKVEKAARARRVHPMQIAETYTRRYFEDMDRLNVLRPDISPRASGHIIEQIEHVKRLLEAGHAYEVNGNVYFDVASWDRYGRLSGRSVDEMQAGARVEARSEKRHPADFALWKRAEPGHILQWPSPWGMGYPGWHIECTVMAQKYLGPAVDIHGGGIENQFPHHENEIAQAEAAGRAPFVKYWLHNNMVTVNGQKMGKSLGNFLTLRDAFERWDPMVLRLFLLQTHYRSQTDFSEEALEAAATGYDRLSKAYENIATFEEQAVDREALDAMSTEEQETERHSQPRPATRILDEIEAVERQFKDAMDDDFGTPEAVGALFGLQKIILGESLAAMARDPHRSVVERIRGTFNMMSGMLGLTFKPFADESTQKLLNGVVKMLLQHREEARQTKDYKAADAIRDKLDNMGITVEDTPDGPKWRQRKKLVYRL